MRTWRGQSLPCPMGGFEALSGTVVKGPHELKVAGGKPRHSATQPLPLQDTVPQVKGVLLMGCQSVYLQDKETSCKHITWSLSSREHQTEFWEPMDTLGKMQAGFEVSWHK